jgi:hypothetical protein
MDPVTVTLHFRRNHCWEGARFGPSGFERTIQADTLELAMSELLAPCVGASGQGAQTQLPEKTTVELRITIPLASQ